MDDEIRRSKELFVTNLNGTTWQEIDCIQLMQPLCVILLSSFMAFVFQRSFSEVGLLSRIIYYVMDFTLSILPLLFALTVLSEYIESFSQFLVVIVFLLLAVTCTNYKNPPSKFILSLHMDTNYLSWYRAYVNVLTAVCILAVDFKIYPRRLAKTESYGTGLMDIFVGAFIMCNSLVCREARDVSMESRDLRGKLASMKKVFTSSLPLTILGIARLVSTKSSNYQEHVTEYGVHWNFFMTLAATRVLSTLMLCLLKPSKSFLLSISFAGIYQYLLCNRLEEYINRPGGRTDDLISANREGIFSLFGYMSLYFAGVAIGRLCFQRKRSSVGGQLKLAFILIVICGCSLSAQLIAESYGLRISRKMANLPFILWTIHHSMLVVSAMLFVGIFYRVVEHMFGVALRVHTSRILDAINYNGLLYFIIANLLTGAVNLLVNTLEKTVAESMGILTCYLFILNTVIYILYLLKIETKFW